MSWFSIYSHYISPVLDVLFLALLLYLVYKVLEKTQAAQLVRGLFVLLVIYAIAFVLRLNALLWLLNTIAPSLLIGVFILFQPELRKMFLKMGQQDWFNSNEVTKHSQIDAVVNAAVKMSEKRRGMLVVFLRKSDISEILTEGSGTKINADVTSAILQTIFEFDTALHDGAVIVQNGKVLFGGCVLHLSDQQDISKSFGTRHRAALGTAECSDAVVLVVSEETGALSLAYDSKIYYDLEPEAVTKRLESLLGVKSAALDIDHKEAQDND